MQKLIKLSSILFFLFTLHFSLCTLRSFADIPRLIGYQGRLTDSQGNPKEGSHSITFRIYDAESGGNLLWNETHSNVTVTSGIFDILLGSVRTLDLAFDKQYYLAIQVGNDPEMTPRQKIASVGYAIRAEKAEDSMKLGGTEVSVTPSANKLLPLDGNAKLPGGVIASDRVVKRDGSFSASDFTNIPGLSLNLATGNNQRIFISFCGRAYSGGDCQSTFVDVAIDGVRLGGGGGGLSSIRQSGLHQVNQAWNISFSILTDILPAGQHTIQIMLSSGTLLADTDYPAILSVFTL